MPKSQRQEIETREIRPYLSSKAISRISAFVETKLDDLEGCAHIEQKTLLAKELREIPGNWENSKSGLELSTLALVIADLLDQGWDISIKKGLINLNPPGLRREGIESVEEAKNRLRQHMQVGQKRQLEILSVRKFIKKMSRPAYEYSGKYSIVDLIDSGEDLSDKFNEISCLVDKSEVAKELSKLVDPVIEVCDEKSRCDITGLRLLDIWRFFRYTWSLEYRSIPGRQMPILIRNAARKNKPVIGIALLASPVLRTRPRDNWIGWSIEGFLESIETEKIDVKTGIRALRSRIEKSIYEIRWDDLVGSKEYIEDPCEKTVLRLEQIAAGAAARRERELQEFYAESVSSGGSPKSQKDIAKINRTSFDWKKASEDTLFVRKRAETLADLLRAKIFFNFLEHEQMSDSDILDIFRSEKGRRCLSIGLQELRKAGLSSQVADLSICGAVAPYNDLIGGKLVALLATSHEVREMWRKRYENQVSIISSQVAGQEFRRPAKLKILTTTSLYGVGSSQYNRLKVDLFNSKRECSERLEWKRINTENTSGYGTAHLSAKTVEYLRRISEQKHSARRVNNRFGEGASPRLRQIREGLDTLGLNSDLILKHEMPRIVYVTELVPNAREELMGFIPERDYEAPRQSEIAEAWRQRWLLRRIGNPEILERLKNLGPTSIMKNLMPDEPFSVDSEGQYLMPLWQ